MYFQYHFNDRVHSIIRTAESLVNQISQYEEDSMERRSAQSDKVARLMELMGKLKQTRSIPPIDVSLFIWYIKNGNSAPSRNRLMTV